MARIYDDQSVTIGRTPLVKLNRIAHDCQATVLAKIEGRNPAFSVKCRLGAGIVWEGEKSGALTPGMTILEATSGNAGIALAFVGASRGYPVKLCMPESMSLERRRLMALLGAELELTPAADGMKGAIAKVEELLAENPETHFPANQFGNPANPLIHETTTGPEIFRDTDGKVDVLVAGVGTGGTITGVSRYLKQTHALKLTTVAVEPGKSPVISQTLAESDLAPGPHGIQGIGAGFIPEVLDLTLIDRVETVEDEEAVAAARELARSEGILCGISSGAAAAVALRLARLDEFAGKTIVVILPDGAERYLSTTLFEGIDA